MSQKNTVTSSAPASEMFAKTLQWALEDHPEFMLTPCNAPRPASNKSVGNAALDRIFQMLGAKRKGIIA